MDEISNEMQDLQNPVEDTTPETNDEAVVQDDSKLKELDAQRKHWREKALKEAEARKKLEEQLARVKPDNRLDSVVEDLTDLKLGQKGLDEEAARFIKTYAKGMGKNALEILEDQTVKDFLQSRKSQKDHDNAIPEPGNRTITIGDKPLSEMSDKELKANWSNVVKAATRKQQ
jgi:hypothetical protein